jgi:N-acetylglucosamine kinase-like BadF-type ATPase
MPPGKASEAAAAILATVHRALEEAGGAADLEVMVVGAAGTGLEENCEALHAALAAGRVAARVHVTTDGAIALESAFPNGPGILLSAGTGSVAHARDADGVVWRVGGRGWRFGDEGSAYALGRAGISAALRGKDGRGPSTALAEAIPSAARAASDEEFQRWLLAVDVAAVARLAHVVWDAAVKGDRVSTELVTSGIDELVSHVQALLRRFPNDATVDVAMNGGLIAMGAPLRPAVVEALGRVAPQVHVVDVEVDPPLGALAVAARMAE